MQGFPPVGFPDGNFDNRFLNINGRPYDFPAAYSQQWNFTIGRQIRDYAIEVAYVGNKANKLMANRNINQPLPGAGSVNSRRIFPGWGSITFQEPRGNSIYHGLQTKVEKRFSLGHLFLLSYTWAKAIDDSDSTQLSTTSGTGNLQDQFNLRAERSRSFQDVRHRLIFSYLWELPFGRGHAWLGNVSPGWNRLVGGWQINGITVLSERARVHDQFAVRSVQYRIFEYPARCNRHLTRSSCRGALRAAMDQRCRISHTGRIRVWKYQSKCRYRSVAHKL